MSDLLNDSIIYICTFFVEWVQGDKQGSVWRGTATTRRGESGRGSDCGTQKGTNSWTAQTCQIWFKESPFLLPKWTTQPEKPQTHLLQQIWKVVWDHPGEKPPTPGLGRVHQFCGYERGNW